ncbi:TULIP family P47-like protein [Clostridium botulinum]|uniref:Toxin complex component ORF-X3 n=1 Tax=Clostridium botulinum (strain Langeland / NCTC 10281 / Type F) TaxID=441772 RepID=A7GBF7_CLOBL|nr:TULIP family P47-like protein [Clostridium botulinum]ABS40665.1 toxin complex component ORF-X3 [Clostridium botulinum F str. Langeland]KKM40130.1 toxin [Clostridium botulinum]MBY6791852.1 TULIP family P47-like protein [Clostridium botulinum]MBY6935859.1 TULIP family P47-like protein [Clostridium botulinum]MBY6943283.1 TULIP family P47-like protein [Clostridium botulinum]
MQTTTLNWDTVYAVPIDIVNEAIKFKHPTPEQFELLDGKYGDCKGSFQEWQIISGGDGGNIRLKIPIKNFRANVIGKYLSGTGGFESANLEIQVKLKYLPHFPQSKNKNERLVDLKIRTKSNNAEDPAIIIIPTSEDVKGFYFNEDIRSLLMTEDDQFIMNYFHRLIKEWLERNLYFFNYVFNTVNLNLYISNNEKWKWTKPSYVDYAYSEIDGDLSKSALGVLCMTDGRKGSKIQQQKIDPYAIPKESQSGFLISEERLLKNILLPTIPKKFPKSKGDEFEVINQSNQGGRYSYILKLKEGKKINLDNINACGYTCTPYIQKMKISLLGNYLRLESTTRIDLPLGVSSICETMCEYRFKLDKNDKGEQTIAYEQIGSPTNKQYTEKTQDISFEIIKGLLIATLGFVLELVPGIGSFLAVALIGGTLVGSISLIPNFIESYNVNTAPNIDLSLENSVSEITWNSSDIFNLNYVALAGPLQLGGTLQVQNT